MPQLDVTTFPSQIFWILLGFAVTYVFVSCVITPNIQRIMEKRSEFVDGMCKRAEQLNAEAATMRTDSTAVLDDVLAKITAAEVKLAADMAAQVALEKENASALMANRLRKEKAELLKSSAEAFDVISGEIDVILNAALDRIYQQTGEES